MSTNKPLILITHTAERPVHMETVHRNLGELAEIRSVEVPRRRMDPREEDELAGQLRDADGLLMRTGYLTRRVMERIPNLKIVAVHSVGLNQVDLEAATERGIYVTNSPGGNAEAVAELTFGLLLALLRRIPAGDRLVREGRWEEATYMGEELQDKVLGIVGLGQIGERVARIARGFNMEILGYDPYVSPSRCREMGVVPVGLRALLGESDVVTLHLPLIPETRGMIGEAELSLMKPTAVLANAARGGLVDEAALYRALAEKRIAGAALDTFSVEPAPAGNPLFTLDNVVVAPHNGGFSQQIGRPMAELTSSDLARFFNGERPRYIGNREVLAVRARLGLKP